MGKVTGTILQKLYGRTREDWEYELAAQKLSRLGDGEPAMNRGTRLEPEAIARFMAETGKLVEEVGFWELEDSIAGLSPDGVISETEAVEVKCLSGGKHLKAYDTGELPKDYYWQVRQYFVVNDKLETLYFVMYNPDMPMIDYFVFEVKRADVQADVDDALELLSEVEGSIDEIISRVVSKAM